MASPSPHRGDLEAAAVLARYPVAFFDAVEKIPEPEGNALKEAKVRARRLRERLQRDDPVPLEEVAFLGGMARVIEEASVRER